MTFLPPDDHPELKWSGKNYIPAIGDFVYVTMNGIGEAEVVGYFVQEGYIGLGVRLLDPPAWWTRQNPDTEIGYVFGAEVDVQCM